MEYFIISILILWILINFTIYRSVTYFAKADRLLEEVEFIEDDTFMNEKKDFDQWCLNNQYEFEKYFLFYGTLNGPPIMCSAWWSDVDKTWALIYISKMGKNIDFHTTFNQGIDLTTASSKDSFTLPKLPSSYVQAFDEISINGLYERHQLTVDEIVQKHQVRKSTENQELLDLIDSSIREQMEFIQKIPFWYLKGSYWYFISRNTEVNKKAII